MMQKDENMIMEAIKKVGVNVEAVKLKEGLIKAFEYDHNQYMKGYEDGKNDVLDNLIAEIEQIVNEEQKHDEKWAKGLKYAVKIIDKYRAAD